MVDGCWNPDADLTLCLGKYSLENALNVRAHAALDGLEQGQLL
jgi:hypothetical protein